MTTPKAYMTLTNEPALVAQATSEPSAFAAIYDFYFDRVYNYVRLRVMDAQLADDLTSEIFERVLTKLDTYRPERGPFAAWLFGIARNSVNSRLRSQFRHRWLSLETLTDHASETPAPDEAYAQTESRHELLAAIRRLDTRDRELIALKFASRLSNQTIAELTGLKANHVGVILHRAVKRLRAELEFQGAHHE
jgi:RNA polymerase sigma-70 factor, ECF subfamily